MKQSIILHTEASTMESLKQSKVIDCHDSAKAESRNDAWDSVIANEVKQSIITNCFKDSIVGFNLFEIIDCHDSANAEPRNDREVCKK